MAAPATPAAAGRPGPGGRPGRTSKGVFVGAITGAVNADNRRLDSWGLRTLGAALILVTATILGRRVAGPLPAGSGALLTAAMALAAVLLLYRVLTDRWSAGHRARSGPGSARRATGAARFGGLPSGTAAGSGGTAPARSAHELTVHRFQVRCLTGEVMTCVLHGELTGGSLRTGDLVRMTARRNRAGDYLVHGIELLATPAGPIIGQVRARPQIGFLVGRWTSRACLALTAVLLVWTAVGLVR